MVCIRALASIGEGWDSSARRDVSHSCRVVGFPGRAGRSAAGLNLLFTHRQSDRGIEGIVSIAARTDGVRLYLMRFIPVEAVSRLKHPDVEALIAAAIEQARVPLPAKGSGRVVVK